MEIPPAKSGDDLLKKWAGVIGRPRVDAFGDCLVVPLIGGLETFRQFYDAIDTTKDARHFIYLLAWWLDDRLWLRQMPGPPLVQEAFEWQPVTSFFLDTSIATLFKAKADLGVQIRVMLWGNPSNKEGFTTLSGNPSVSGSDTPGLLATMAEAGAIKEPFEETFSGFVTGPGHRRISRWINDLNSGAAIIDTRTSTLAGSHHQKLLVVAGSKGLVGFCGGVDINADRVRRVDRNRGQPLHDVHCKVLGPGARELTKAFIRRWDAHPDHAAIDRQKGDLLARTYTGDQLKKGTSMVRVVATSNRVLGTGQFGQPKKVCKSERSMRDTLLAAIGSAEKFIYFEDQYIISLDIAKALRAALSRVSFVIGLVPHPSICDLPKVWSLRKRFIETVGDPKRDRFRLYYRVSPNGDLGEGSYVHSKTWVFDDEIALIGSANANNRGLSSDTELGVWTLDGNTRNDGKSVARSLRMALWSQHLGRQPEEFLNPDQRHWDDSQSEKSRVRSYPDPESEKDRHTLPNLIPTGLIDPDVEHLPECS